MAEEDPNLNGANDRPSSPMSSSPMPSSPKLGSLTKKIGSMVKNTVSTAWTDVDSAQAGAEAGAVAKPQGSKWKRAAGLVSFIGNLSKPAVKAAVSVPVDPGILGATPLASLLRDVCQATGYAYGEVWERPLKPKRRRQLFGGANTGPENNTRGKRRSSLVQTLLSSASAEDLLAGQDPEDGRKQKARPQKRRSSIAELAGGIAAGLPGLGASPTARASPTRGDDPMNALFGGVEDVGESSLYAPRMKIARNYAVNERFNFVDGPLLEARTKFLASATDEKYAQGAGLVGKTWQQGKLISLDLGMLDGRHKEYADDLRLAGAAALFDVAICAPVIVGNVVRGAVVVYKTPSCPAVPPDKAEDVLLSAIHVLGPLIKLHTMQTTWKKTMDDCSQNLEPYSPEDDMEINNLSDAMEYAWIRTKMYWSKMAGQNQQPHAGYSLKHSVWAAFGVLVTLLVVLGIDHLVQQHTYREGTLFALIASFGAVATNLFAVPSSPMSQPRSVLCAHLIAGSIALLVDYLTNQDLYPILPQWLGTSLAPALAAALMAYSGTIHPPAGACAVIYMMGDDLVKNVGWLFLLVPVLLDCFVAIFLALVLNNISSDKQSRYPIYW